MDGFGKKDKTKQRTLSLCLMVSSMTKGDDLV